MVGKAPLGECAQGQTHHRRALGRAIPRWVACPQSPPPFHPAGGKYPPGPCGARPTIRVSWSLALSVAMERSFVVLLFGSASTRKTLNPLSTVRGELQYLSHCGSYGLASPRTFTCLWILTRDASIRQIGNVPPSLSLMVPVNTQSRSPNRLK